MNQNECTTTELTGALENAHGVGESAVNADVRLREPSKDRGCDGKANLGRGYVRQADRLAAKHGKRYGVYRCPHCGGTHLTTKLHNAGRYAPLLHDTGAD